MKIVVDKPPIWDEIVKAFPAVEHRACIFAWGGTIFNPGNITVGHELMAHELVHGARQKDDIRGWWRRYIDDPQFRLKEELQAHKAEFARAALGVKDRNRRARILSVTAQRLAAPLYGGVIAYQDALYLLRH